MSQINQNNSPGKRWTMCSEHPDAAELARELKVSALVAQILITRGVTDACSARDFLRPSLMHLHDPSLLHGLERAANRIAKAIRDKQRIVIYGDYDVDGITSISILWHAIKLLGGDVGYYVPHRIDEGYGLNSEALTQIIDSGARLIITVDCGITAVGPARVARLRGIDLIITDHHDFESADHLPDCFAVVHPRLGDVPYPNENLCGAGVAFKLAWGIGKAMNGEARVTPAFREFLLEATALAALGTIADVVPLVGENRVLACFGLGGLKASKLTGIRALIASAALTGQNIDSYHVGFCLAPRLNACGRMGHALLAVKMLTDSTEDEAKATAAYLEQQNRARQTTERAIVEQALAQVADRRLVENDCRAIVLGSDQWHAGVVGIVASRLVDKLCRPAVIVALSNGHGQGSARSIAGFHLAKALQACGEHLIAHGGHEMAAGLKIETSKFDDFQAAFCHYAAEHVEPDMMRPLLHLEADACLADISPSLVTDLHRLGPFGHGNAEPLLRLQGVEVCGGAKIVGQTGKHVQFSVRSGSTRLKCIAFGQAGMLDQLKDKTRIDLAVEPLINEFNGNRNVELEVKDMQICETSVVA